MLISLDCGSVAFVTISVIIHVYFSFKTWIGNRRRKYRLMGIEVPPPRGGPADFSDQSEFVSKSALNPGEETATEVGDDNDRNDEVSICLSEGSSQGIWKCVHVFLISYCVHALCSLSYMFRNVWECHFLYWQYYLVSYLSVWMLPMFLSQSLQKLSVTRFFFCQIPQKLINKFTVCWCNWEVNRQYKWISLLSPGSWVFTSALW